MCGKKINQMITKFMKKIALPIIKNNPSSNWLTINKELEKDIYKFLGKCSYKARTGVLVVGQTLSFI